VATLIANTYWLGAPFRFREPPDDAKVEPLVLRAPDMRELTALYWTPDKHPAPRVAVVCIHPRVDFTRHYAFPRLLAAGFGCLGASSRHPNNDCDTVHEEIVLDVAACVNFLRERGVATVVLLGNSGGGSLSALYQAQARLPAEQRIAAAPSGAPTLLPKLELSPADALIWVAAHPGQGRVLGACIDPAVTEEADPLATDPALDMYDPANGFADPPAWSEYRDDFVARFREAQRARVARLDKRAHELLARRLEAVHASKRAGFSSLPAVEQRRIMRQRHLEQVMVVYRTMANPSYVDERLDPSQRPYGSLLSDRPDLMNMRYLGFARTCTPRAWLSTWSAASSNADMVKNVAGITEPSLLVSARADREIYPSAHRAVAEAMASDDKTALMIDGAGHYFEPAFGESNAPHREQLMDSVVAWLEQRFEV